jgi:hypothetical protein
MTIFGGITPKHRTHKMYEDKARLTLYKRSKLIRYFKKCENDAVLWRVHLNTIKDAVMKEWKKKHMTR